MYLARLRTKGDISYVIRQSYPSSGHFKYRDLFHLGTDPTRFIHYPGGNGYYFDPCIEEAFHRKGVDFSPDDLDAIFFEFLDPEIQRVITGFDRNYRHKSHQSHDSALSEASDIHPFDKRRFHYIRFGHSQQRHIHIVPDKIFQPLQRKSRDELEHYFESQERKLRYHEIGPYIATIFQLTAFSPDSSQNIVAQLDTYFIDQLCQLNSDGVFLAGEPQPKGLFRHLIKYAIVYFDHTPMEHSARWQYVTDFINRHRIYRPPVKIQIKIKEAEQLFGYDWKDLKQMDRTTLTRLFRKLALKHHPDRGGNAETFRRLAKYYKALIQKKPKR